MDGGSIDGPAACWSLRAIGDFNGLLCVTGTTVTDDRGDIGDKSNGLLDDAGFARTRLNASLRDILCRSQLVDADSDEGPASTMGGL